MLRGVVFIIERNIFSASTGIICCSIYSCGSTVILHLRDRLETFPWPAYHHSHTILIAGYLGIKPVDGRRIRGFSLTSLNGRERGYSLASLNGRERGYSLASQGGMTSEDVEMMERT